MGWSNMTPDQMEAELLRQAKTIGIMREALADVIRECETGPAPALRQVIARKARKGLSEPERVERETAFWGFVNSIGR